MLVIASFLLGIYVSNSHTIWGNVDLLSKKENKVIKLTEPVTFTTPDGAEVTLEKGTKLNWEGFYNYQNFFSVWYLIEGFDSFEVINEAGVTGEYNMHKIESSTLKPNKSLNQIGAKDAPPG